MFSDIRQGLRVIYRAPSFAVGVIAVLALGIGANTAMFSIVNTVLLRPLPFAEPDRLVRLFHVPPQSAFPGIPTFSVSAANFYDWQRGAHTFEAMAIYPVQELRSMEDVLDQQLTSQRFSTLVLGLFASVALALASIGIYSVLSYIVRGRSHEIGIRAALGASSADVVRLVVVEGMMPALAGITAGAAAALASARLLNTLVFGVRPSDPLTLFVVVATLAVIALLASLIPAYRASRLDPAKVLHAN